MLKISNDELVLKKEFRASALKYFKEAGESNSRVKESLRRHKVYNDKTKEEVIEYLKREVSLETFEQMKNRAANISVCRKVIDKLAASYIGGVERKAEQESDQEAVDELSRLLELDTKMKKLDRSFELQKNAMFAVLPYKAVDQDALDGDQVQYVLKARIYEPYRYHVILDSNDEEAVRAVVLEESNYGSDNSIVGIPSTADGHGGVGYPGAGSGKKDESLFIWWTARYHFTTNIDGDIVSAPDGSINPIGTLPLVSFSECSDGEYWSDNGCDLIDGSIMINLLLTDMLTIANVQGWGQLVMVGKNLPKTVQVGPHKAIVLDMQDGDPQPQVDYKTSNAPLETWMRMIEQYTALMLSTNHLSPSTVSGKLDARNPDSGIAMLIEQSESTLDLEDRQQMYQAKERRIWEIIRRWQEVYNGAFAPVFAQVPILKSSDVQVKFYRTKPVITEEQKLKNLELRKELGLNTMVELLKLDNPDLSNEEAEERLVKIMEEKMKQMELAMRQAMSGEEDENKEDSNEEDGGKGSEQEVKEEAKKS